VDLENGRWEVNGKWVYDSEFHNSREVTLREAFKRSSNVGMAKLVMRYYESSPQKFIDHLQKLRFHQKSGIDLTGEEKPILRSPGERYWSKVSLPWLSFGYGVNVSPLQTLTLYNAIANNGVMMKPYLVSSILENGLEVETYGPEVLDNRIAGPSTLNALRSCLEGVCNEEGGTAAFLFRNTPYKVAGKTGTSLVAKPGRGYKDHIHQSSFAGYFPADKPKYSCIVVIENRIGAEIYYGGKVAGPVFKEIADKLYAWEINEANYKPEKNKSDSATYFFAGKMQEIKQVFGLLGWSFRDSSSNVEWGRVYAKQGQPVLSGQSMVNKKMPDLKGMGVKDALFLLEKMGLSVKIKGQGKLSFQSVAAGSMINKKDKVQLEFN
jgi:cell division protein FtsI (penicillin-binding protein 3)